MAREIRLMVVADSGPGFSYFYDDDEQDWDHERHKRERANPIFQEDARISFSADFGSIGDEQRAQAHRMLDRALDVIDQNMKHWQEFGIKE